MKNLFNIIAIVVKAGTAANAAATEVLRKEGHIILPFVKELVEAYGESELPAALEAYRANEKFQADNKPSWVEPLAEYLEKFMPEEEKGDLQ